ncbi:MAG: ABC transporter ATP-binding protein [Planctomycetota bacterium]|nr:ABC transporter ATP-binding protein [Planctomycetota bacterium]
MIRTRELTKSYHQTPVLQGVSMDVAAGTIHGFVGPNGAGKSTFLKCLVGVVHPDSGDITVDGLDARRESLKVRTRIGYAPAETTLYHRMESRELLDFAIRYHPSPDLARGLALLDQLEVPANRRVGALSHGMKRKLLLVQAIASNAPIMVLDEPMEALDPEARRIVEGLMRDEVSAGRTIFMSSHDLYSTQRLCSRVTFLHHGRVLRDGPVHELLTGIPGRLHVQFRSAMRQDDLPTNDGLQWTGANTNWQVRFQCSLEQAMAHLSTLPMASIRDDGGHLEDLFDQLYQVEQGVES